MNITVQYNINQNDVVTRVMTGVQAPDIAANAFLQFKNLDGSLNFMVPLGRLCGVEFEHDLVQPATINDLSKRNLSLV